MIDDVQIIVINPGSGSGSSSGSQTYIGPVLSSEVGDLEFVVSSDSADIRVAEVSSGVEFFSASLHAFNGRCSLYQAGDIIADFMRSKDMSFGSFIVRETNSGASVQLSVLLSDRVMSGGYIAAARFPLLGCSSLVVPSFGSASLYFITDNPSSARFSASVRGIDSDGNSVVADVSLAGAYTVDGAISAIDICPDALVDYINLNCRLSFEFDSIQFVRVLCSCGSQYFSASVYAVDDPDYIGFRFRNNFGLFEWLYLHAEAVPVLKSDAQSAVMGHNIVQYDVENEQSFSVSAANISADEWPRVSQFISSREILDAYGRRILLSDVSSEIGKTYDGLGSLKFSYRFADTRIVSD
ncbi:MAG: hypothetical protein NC095_07780 [Muribaculum sp.]|nr:hypothetical protein [Muribaculum sp.]